MASDAVPVSMVMTCDDAVEMMFMDGSRVQLSPCGSCFMYDPPISHGISQSYQGPGPGPGPSHPLYTSTRTQQRTCFVTSKWRSKVMAALEFRNRFASRPFLCTDLSQEDKQLELYADITHVEWSNSSGKCTFSEHPDHSLELTSGDSLATLILSPSGQDFSVKYLCKLQPESDMAVNSSRGTSHLEMQLLKSCEAKQECSDMKFSRRTSMGNPMMTQDCQDERDEENVSQNGQHFKGHTDPMMSQRVSSEEKVPMRRPRCKFWYTWVVQNHSVAHCPWYWRHPLDLLLKHKAEIMKTADVHVAESTGASLGNDLDDSNQDFPEQLETHSSPLPPSLPLRCDESHLHKHHWRTIKQDALDETGEADTLTMYGRKVSILVVGRVVYRLFWDPLPSIEVYPGNGEVIMSHDERGSFFRLVKIRSDGSLKELMISVSNPPPGTPHSSYSIAELVRRGSRLLQCIIVYQRTIGGGDNLCCWKKMELDDTSGNAGILMERSIIPGLGQLEVYSSGIIRGYFNDEVTIETNCIHPLRSDGGPMDLQVDDDDDTIFTVMLSDGCRKIVTSRNPGAYLRHVNALMEWRRWAGQSSEERLALIETKRNSAEISKSAVQTELLRIRNLTYMIDHHGGIPGVEGGKDLTTKENKGCTDNDVTTMSIYTGINGSSRTFHSDRILSENLTEDDIAKALRDTALAVCDIEGMLGYQ